MIEAFKIKAYPLNRILRIGVSLPNNYYESNKSFKTIIALDGHLFFNYIDDNRKKYDYYNDNIIFIGLFSPLNDIWRISEVNPYYDGDSNEYEANLSTTYFDYIKHELIPFLKQKYKISDELYTLGINDSSIASLILNNNYDIFKKAIIINLKKDYITDKFIEDFKNNYEKFQIDAYLDYENYSTEFIEIIKDYSNIKYYDTKDDEFIKIVLNEIK